MNPKTTTWIRTGSRVLASATALTLLTAGGLIGANLLLRKPPPAPLWTEKDLPAAPDPASNGWELLRTETSHFRPTAPPSSLASLTDLSKGRSADSAWADARTQRSAIVSYVADPSRGKWQSALARALSKPRFADGCPVSIGADCELLPIFNLHKLGELGTLDQALDGRWNEAFLESAKLTTADFALVGSSRSLLSTMVALAQCKRIVDLIDVLLAGYRAAATEGERTPVDAPTITALALALGSLREEHIDLQRPVIAEYLHGVEALTLVQSSPGAMSPGAPDLGPLARVMLDHGATMQMLNDDYRPLAEFARSPLGATPPTRPERTTSMTWWLHNAIGKQLLDSMQLDIGLMITKAATDRAALMTRRDAVRAQLAATFPGS